MKKRKSIFESPLVKTGAMLMCAGVVAEIFRPIIEDMLNQPKNAEIEALKKELEWHKQELKKVLGSDKDQVKM